MTTYLFGLTNWTPQFFLGLESLFGLVELRLAVLLGATFFLVGEIETAKRIVFHDVSLRTGVDGGEGGVVSLVVLITCIDNSREPNHFL